METLLEKQHLQTITVPLHQLQWVEKGKEVKIAGELFDVKEYTIQNNICVLTGLFDKEEKKLHSDLEKMIDNQKENRENSSGLTSFIFSFNSCQNRFTDFTPLHFINIRFFGIHKACALANVFAEPPFLPPNT